MKVCDKFQCIDEKKCTKLADKDEYEAYDTCFDCPCCSCINCKYAETDIDHIYDAMKCTA